ncbi:MAG: CDP-alcohol phosphatidyltransferase family protein [Bacteroidia bacterium]
MIKQIPNAITSANLFFGCLSIVATFDGNPTLAATYIVIAAILDFFDGFAARLLKVSGEMGKQLDSLADVVSFGVAPGFIFYMHSQEHLMFSSNFFQFVPLLIFISYLPFSLMIFSAIRLAKFNIDPRQSDSFIGLPTPANALFICAIPFVMANGPLWAENIFTSLAFLSLYPIIFSYLLIAELPLFALKFKQFSFKGNEIRYIFIALCTTLLIAFTYVGIALSIVLYLLLSIYLKVKNNPS